MKIQYRKKCEACKGTGLYVGICERDGAAVVCCKCKGLGFQDVTIEYDVFISRENPPKGVTRVYQVNPGIVIGVGGEKQFNLADFGGYPLAEWMQGVPFPPKTENRKFTCPAWWYQIADFQKKPRWKECIICGTFSECKNFSEKDKCWKRWDEEFGKEKVK